MKVLILSDTHGSLSAFEAVERFFEGVDLVLHLGDVLYHGPRNPIPEGYDPKSLAERLKEHDIVYVRGNCDADVDLMVLGLSEMPRVRRGSFGSVDYVMAHGDLVEDPYSFAMENEAKVVLLGHSHIPVLRDIEGILVLNPGSPSLPKGGYPGSFAILNVDGSHVEAKVLDLKGDVILKGGFDL